MSPWQLTRDEWKAVGLVVAPPPDRTEGRGRPRNPVTRQLVEACLYRHYHSKSPGTGHSFGWNALPRSFGVSPATANRRYREWLDDGTWGRLWETLQSRRNAARSAKPFISPVAEAVLWLERAYRHFDETLFGGGLPAEVVITLEAQMRTEERAYFSAWGWALGGGRRAHHIMVSAGVWSDGAEATLAALLHEAVHARCHSLRLPDTSELQYHNRHFRDTALVSGLRCGARHPQWGYAKTTLDDRGRGAVGAFLAADPFPGRPVAEAKPTPFREETGTVGALKTEPIARAFRLRRSTGE